MLEIAIHGRIYSQQGPVQKKMWEPFNWDGRQTLFFLEKNWRPFLVITVCQLSLLLKNWRLFCSSLSFSLGVAYFFRHAKITAPFVGALFVGAPVRPNMLNMPKSVAVATLKR